MRTEYRMEMGNIKYTVSTLAAIVIFCILLYHVIFYWLSAPDMTYQEIEGLNSSAKITAVGNNFTRVGGEEEFVALIKENNITEIFYSLAITNGGYSCVKKYWGISPDGIFEYEQTHLPSDFSLIKECSGDSVVLEKSHKRGLAGLLAASLVAFLGFLVLYLVLTFLAAIFRIAIKRMKP